MIGFETTAPLQSKAAPLALLLLSLCPLWGAPGRKTAPRPPVSVTAIRWQPVLPVASPGRPELWEQAVAVRAGEEPHQNLRLVPLPDAGEPFPAPPFTAQGLVPGCRF